MSNADQIKTTMERSIKAITRRPAVGKGSQVMTVAMDGKGCCRVADGDEEIVIDLSPEYGGGGTTATPGFLVRAALGACLAQGYHIQAACLGVPLDRLSVELHSAYDMRGNFGIDDSVPRSYTAFRYVVTIESPAPRAAVEAVIERSDALDFVRDVFARAIPLERELRISQTAAAG